jgi:type I restriction enzyme S subunit
MSELDKSELTNIPGHWKVSTMSNETEFITDYVANGSFAALAENVNYKSEPDYAVLIRLTDFNSNYNGNFVYVDKKAYDFLNKSKLFGGEIIISNVGAYAGTVFFAPNLDIPMTLGPNSIMMNFKNGNQFYYYWLKSPMGKFLLEGIISGSAQPKFNKTAFRQMQVPVPPLEEQKAIASILSSLDDKIDLLHRQNETLEKMAETLFRKWFVEDAKEDWEVGKLDDILSTKGGSTPSTTNPKFWNGDIHWTSPRDITTLDGIFLFDTERKITKEGLSKISSGLLPKGTLLMSSRAPVGVLAFSEVEISINQGYIAIIDDKDYSKEFIFLWLKINMDYVQSFANGSTFQEISKSAFKTIEIQLIPRNIRKEFDKLIMPLFDKIKANQIQLKSLTKMRDTLLPKLMSGEVRVKLD